MRQIERYHAVLLVALALVALDLTIRALEWHASSRPPGLSSAFTSLEWQETVPVDHDAVFYVVFQPADCVIALKALQFWNELQDSGVATVRGVMIEAPSDAVKREEIVQRAGIRFPVAQADTRATSRILRELGYSHTLVAVLVDRDGIVRLTMPTREQDLKKLTALQAIVETARNPTQTEP